MKLATADREWSMRSHCRFRPDLCGGLERLWEIKKEKELNLLEK